MATIDVVKPGLLTTIQDGGRTGYCHLGMPRSGCMDDYSQCLANYLVGNDVDTAVLEVTLQGPELVFNSYVVVGIAGALFDIYINDDLQQPNISLFLKPGDRLRFGRLHSGCRAYLAVSGGFAVKLELQSASTYLQAGIGGYHGRALRAGDVLQLRDTQVSNQIKAIPVELNIDYTQSSVIRIVKGVEYDWFATTGQQDLFTQSFTVTTDSNRMGYRLQCSKPLAKVHLQDMLTTAVTTGTIQVPDSGQPIIVLADGQTTGGYPRIANVISADLHLLGQCKPGDDIRFFMVSQEKALTIYRDKKRLLKQRLAT